MRTFTTLLVIGMFATTVAMADDSDDVRAALQRYTSALTAGDANALMQLHAVENASFGAGGGLLETFDSPEERRSGFQALRDSGFKLNVQLRHVEVSVYGDTAVTTSYAVGTVTQPNGTTGRVNNRLTTVWVKQGGQWKEVHRHLSPLRLPQ